MTQGWILDVGAVYDGPARVVVAGLLPQARILGKRIVLPTHVLMELVRQETYAQRDYEAHTRGDPAQITASAVHAALKRDLYGVELLDFSDADALALLAWLDRPGAAAREWEVKKLRKAVEEGWPPIRDALRALSCPTCCKSAEDCPCTQPLWSEKLDKGQLLQSAYTQAARLAQANEARASSTMDWLTAAMARRQGLTIVTRDKRAIEWDGLPWIAADQLGAKIGGQP